MSAALEMFVNVTKRYGKPAFGLRLDAWWTGSRPRWSRRSSGRRPSATSSTSAATRWPRRRARIRRCWWSRRCPATMPRSSAAPSATCLPDHEIYITDWIDAREVPVGDRRLRPRRLYRPPDRDDRGAVGRGRAHRGDGRLPARHPGDGRRQPDVDGGQPAAPGLDGADGLADRHRPQSEAAERVRRQEAALLVREQRRRPRAMAEPGLHAPGLSRLPAALGLSGDEHGPPRRCPRPPVPEPRPRRRRRRRAAPRLLRRIPRGDGPRAPTSTSRPSTGCSSAG